MKTEQFNECQANGMVGEDCEKYVKMLEEMERSPIP
jgi:hypothetical protein